MHYVVFENIKIRNVTFTIAIWQYKCLNMYLMKVISVTKHKQAVLRGEKVLEQCLKLERSCRYKQSETEGHSFSHLD